MELLDTVARKAFSSLSSTVELLEPKHILPQESKFLNLENVFFVENEVLEGTGISAQEIELQEHEDVSDSETRGPVKVTATSVGTNTNVSTVQFLRRRSKSRGSRVSVRFEDEESLSSDLLRTPTPGKLVDCRNKASGCKAKVPQGTLLEIEHYQTCKFRPIPCLMQQTCSELVPYHNFLLHHMQHFLHPAFSATLSTAIYFEREDFHRNQRWNPRWLNSYNKDFFVMLSHKLPGMWYVWVWMLGTPEEAADFTYEIEISGGELSKSGIFPVLSVRTTTDEIEKSEICLSMTDFRVKKISQINENIIGYLDMDLVIYRTPKGTEKSHWLM